MTNIAADDIKSLEFLKLTEQVLEIRIRQFKFRRVELSTIKSSELSMIN